MPHSRLTSILAAVSLLAAAAPASAGAVTLDRTPPPVPTGVKAISGAAQATFSWTPVAASDLHHYNVYRRMSTVSAWGSPIATTATSRTDTGLTNDQSYDYAVSATDTAGNVSAPSAIAKARPEPAVFSAGPHMALPAGYVYTPNKSCNTGTNITIASNGECYSLLAPTNGTVPSATKRTPVLVVLHGGVPVDTTASHASTWGRIITKARAQGWQVAIPLTPYNEPQIASFMSRMYSDLTTNRFADANRVNMVGFSAGGYAAMMALCAQRTMFNSVAAMAGSIPGDAKIGQNTYFPCTQATTRPSLLILTGDQDQPNYSGCLSSANAKCDTDSAGKPVPDPFTLALNPMIQAPPTRVGEKVLYYSDLHITAAWAAWNTCATHTYQSDASAAAPTDPMTASPLVPGTATRHTWSACSSRNLAGKQSEVAFDTMLGGAHMAAYTNATLDESWNFLKRQN